MHTGLPSPHRTGTIPPTTRLSTVTAPSCTGAISRISRFGSLGD